MLSASKDDIYGLVSMVDTLLVAGWKTRTVEGRMRKKFFLAPDGSSFACRRSGLQHMLREGFPAPAIAEMKAKLSHEGFCYFCPLLCGFGSGTGLKTGACSAVQT
jgi:hypothetical protein